MVKKLNLLEITDHPWPERWNPLICFLKEKFGVELTAEIVTSNQTDVAAVLKQKLTNAYDVCRVSDSLAEFLHETLTRTTYEAAFIGGVAFLVRDRNDWWPRPLLAEALSKTLSDNVGQLDINSFALVAGAGAVSKLVMASLVKMGFGTINVADIDLSKAQKLVAELQKKYFQTVFVAVPFEEVTTLPGIYSVMVNTTPLSLDNVLLEELYFFNFLRPGGVVVDLTLLPSKTPLIEEAEQWGARHLSGDFIMAARDALMIELTTAIKIPVEKYRVQLRKQIDLIPFDSSPYIKRFRERGT